MRAIFKSVFHAMIFLLFAVWTAAAQVPAVVHKPDSGTPETYRSIQAIKQLPREYAANNKVAVLEGILTFVVPPAVVRGMTLQDETGDIYVDAARVPYGGHEFKSGDRVRIVGFTDQGDYAPMVFAEQMEFLGTGSFPTALPVRLADLYTGVYDSRLVVLQGVIAHAKAFSETQSHLVLKTIDGVVTCCLFKPCSQAALDELVDKDVAICGVCNVIYNTRAELAGVELRLAEFDDIQVFEDRDSDPFTAPDMSPADLLSFSLEGPQLHRYKMTGVVSAVRGKSSFFLNTDDRGIHVSIAGTTLPKVGEMVEVSGFIDGRRFFAGLEYAQVRTIGQGELPPPIVIDRALIFAEPYINPMNHADFDGNIVSITGSVCSIDMQVPGIRTLSLNCDGYLLTVDLGAIQLPPLRLDSIVKLTGVCEMTFSEHRPLRGYPRVSSFTVIPRFASDIVVVQNASWWTTGRLALVIVGLVSILVGIIAWNVSLRRLAERRSRQLLQECQARLAAELRVEERTRLAAELHDSFAQSLTGIAMQVEAAELAQQQAPDDVSTYLRFARQLLASCREEIRRCVWNLRAQILEHKSFTEALREVASHYRGGATEVTVVAEGTAYGVSDSIVHSLLRIVQESIANAIQHGHAHHVQVNVRFSDDALFVDIQDDGEGFVPEQARGAATGHFGISGMRERVKRLGGQFELVSSPGAGTCVKVEIPKRS